ncbi:MAG: hypothetical protein H7320_24240, partial [Ferruginibacter sp.]|nr:hypothetical protein [Ferruginibacter sp.]
FEETSANLANLQAALLIMLPAIGVTAFKIPAAELAAQKALDGTRTAIELVQEKFPENYDTSVLVDELTAKLINDFMSKWFVVKGRLTDSQQQGLAAHTILLGEYDLDFAGALGETITNIDGSFEFGFTYDERIQNNDGLTNPDIGIQIISPSGLELPIANIFTIVDGAEKVAERLADSPKAPIVLMNVGNETIVRIVPVTNEIRLTEFENLVAALRPFMGKRDFADLKEDDQNFHISFLNKETGIQKSTIKNLKNAFVNERESNLAAWAFFGLSSTPLPISEWNNKTLEEFIALLQSFKPANTTEDINALAEKLRAFAKDTTVKATVQDYKSSVGNLLAPIFQTSNQLDLFLEQYTRHEGSTEEFWKGMEQNTMFSQDVPKIQLTLQLSQLTLGNIGLVQSLQDKGITDTKELVNFSNEDWQALTILHPEGIPQHIVADTVQERANIYAGELQTLVELAFPNEVIKKTVTSEGVLKFLDQNPDFDFTKTPVESYLQSKGDAALHNIIDHETVLNEVRETQRLYAITASAADSKLLASMGFSSAKQIGTLAFNDFISLTEGKISTDQAALYHTKAASITESAALMYMQLRELTNTKEAPFVGDSSDLLKTIPNWQNLFGDIATCECEHCRSVYSPAAYFVDLLHVLLGQSNRNKKDEKVREELFRRRPDLKYTKLSCEHTDTLIPYIDLVNEILETYVANIFVDDKAEFDYKAVDDHAQIATKDKIPVFTADELAANPQHPSAISKTDADAAYQLVSNATYPLSLPFDLNLETARQFLLAQNSSLYELMTTFADAKASMVIAESLGLSLIEYNILAGKNTITQPGQGPKEVDWQTGLDLFGYDAAAWTEDVCHLRNFLDKTSIAYTDLIDLVETQFLNANKNIRFGLVVPSNVTPDDKLSWEVAHACDLEFTRLIHEDLMVLEESELANFNRFIRLWKKLGCTVTELDILLSALGNTFTPELISGLSALWQLKQTLNISAEQAAVLVNIIPVAGEHSLYNRLFLNKAILQIDPNFTLNTSGDELENNTENIAGHQAAILAAFQISEQDLNDITQFAEIDIAAINTLNLKNLSLIYRFVLLAKINRLKVHELILLLPFAPNPQFTSSKPSETVVKIARNQEFFNKIKRYGLNASA